MVHLWPPSLAIAAALGLMCVSKCPSHAFRYTWWNCFAAVLLARCTYHRKWHDPRTRTANCSTCRLTHTGMMSSMMRTPMYYGRTSFLSDLIANSALVLEGTLASPDVTQVRLVVTRAILWDSGCSFSASGFDDLRRSRLRGCRVSCTPCRHSRPARCAYDPVGPGVLVMPVYSFYRHTITLSAAGKVSAQAFCGVARYHSGVIAVICMADPIGYPGLDESRQHSRTKKFQTSVMGLAAMSRVRDDLVHTVAGAGVNGGGLWPFQRSIPTTCASASQSLTAYRTTTNYSRRNFRVSDTTNLNCSDFQGNTEKNLLETAVRILLGPVSSRHAAEQHAGYASLEMSRRPHYMPEHHTCAPVSQSPSSAVQSKRTAEQYAGYASL
jgi:hypothetical protein